MLFSLIAGVALLVALPDDTALPRSGISAKDLTKAAPDVSDYFEALETDRRGDQEESLASLNSAIAKAAARAKVEGEALTYLGDWEVLIQNSKPEQKTLKSKYGRGFTVHTFTDPYDGRSVEVLLSLPKDYPKATEAFYPTLIGLKPVLGLEGKDLRARVTDLASAMYADLVATHIVLVPLGETEGAGKKAMPKEHEGVWLGDGLYALLTSMRVLFEQIRFDRSRLFVDGWGEAGVEAMQLASVAPAWFAGVINRGGGTGDDQLILENLDGKPLLYVKGLDALGDASSLKSRVEGITELSIVEDAEAPALEPSDNGRAAVAGWLEGKAHDLAPTKLQYKLGDIRFQSHHWLKAMDINRRPTANPGDADFPRMEASIDRDENLISIKTTNVFELFVFLSDAMLDLDKEVVIEVNGEVVVSQVFARDPRLLLDNVFLNNSGDLGLYCAEVRIADIDPNLPESDDEADEADEAADDEAADHDER